MTDAISDSVFSDSQASSDAFLVKILRCIYRNIQNGGETDITLYHEVLCFFFHSQKKNTSFCLSKVCKLLLLRL